MLGVVSEDKSASSCETWLRLGIVQDIKANVDQLLAHMEVAAEKDMEANKQGKPAVMKLKMLPQVSVSLLMTLSMHHGGRCL